MGHFSNGSEGCSYEAKYCCNCLHYKDPIEKGCPVWGMHILHCYGAEKTEKDMLNMLIPVNKKGYNLKCKMFVTLEYKPRKSKQLSLL